MEATLDTAPKVAPAEPQPQSHENLVERKCACGGSAGLTGACSDCQHNRLTVQRYSRDRKISSTLLAPFGQSLNLPQRKDRTAGGDLFGTNFSSWDRGVSLKSEGAINPLNDRGEVDQTQTGPVSDPEEPVSEFKGEPRDPQTIPGESSLLDENAAASREAEPAVGTQNGPEPESNAAANHDAGGLVVEDDAADISPHQMRKNVFLDELRTEICAVADAELTRVGRSTEGCPYIEQWINYYRARDVQSGERALRRYAPETAGVSSAREYIPIVAERVRRAVAAWAMNGQITGVPAELAHTIPDQTGGSQASASIMAKARDGGLSHIDEPASIQNQLGPGSPLDTGIRSRMESAFGHDFSRVRIHNDSRASALSSRMNARAFTIGDDISFGSGEYKPGSLEGEALIAHELAHVVQQEGSLQGGAPKDPAAYSALEDDADRSAVGAVVSLWGKAKGAVTNFSRQALPRLKTGLRLSRCNQATPRLRKSTVAPATTGNCGQYSWGIQWSIENVTPSTQGWIVQHIQSSHNVRGCDDVAKTDAEMRTLTGGWDPAWYPFWEAWQVRNGQIFVGGGTGLHTADTFGWTGPGDDTKGTRAVTGSADFYPNLTLPASFVVRNAPPAHSLPYTQTNPNLTGGTGALAHNISSAWNCCPRADGSKDRTTTVVPV